jgi:hypothetical protein
LKINTSPDFETKSSYSIRVRTTDQGGLPFEKQFTITINDLVETPGTHLNFDGANDRVDITLPAVFNNTTANAFSVEAWMKPSALVFSRVFFAQKDVSNFFSISLGNDGTIYAYLNNTTSVRTTAAVSTTNWTQVTVTKEAVTNTILIYFNGVLQATGGGGTSTTGTDNLLTLGSRTNQVQFYNGSLDEVRVWDRVLPVAEILNNTNCELPTPTTQTGLVAYYQFNQGLDAMDNTGITSLTDSSVTANNGTLFNFGLTGTTSNWLSGSPIVTGTTCGALGTTSFEIASKLNIFPNPATNNVTILFADLNNAKLEVLDITGKVLMKQSLNLNSNTVNIEKLPAGMYLFKVTSNEGTATSKVIKN